MQHCATRYGPIAKSMFGLHAPTRIVGGASLLGADASLGPNKLAGAHLGDRGLGNYCDNLRIILS